MISGAIYDAVDDTGLHYHHANEESLSLPVDNVVLCSGQISNRTLYEHLLDLKVNARLIGGADVASELDALRAIDQATRLALAI